MKEGARAQRALPAAGALRILIVKLSSLGDVVHSLPVVADLRAAYPRALIDWVVEPAFAPLLERVDGIAEVIGCPLRGWTQGRPVEAVGRSRDARASRARLRRERYDAVVDLQGLTKSAVIARLARGPSYGLANRTDGASHEAPARWLVSKAIRVEPHSHALDRARELVASALGTRVDTPPSFGLSVRASPASARPRTVVLIHGTSRADKLWPQASWIELGRRLADEGWAVALPQASAEEGKRARAIAAAIGGDSTVWPQLELGALHRSPRRERRRDRHRQRTEPHRRRARPAARPALQLPDLVANRPAGAPQRRPAGRGRRRAGADRRGGVGGVEGRAERRPRRRGTLGAEAAVSSAARRRAARAAYSLLLRLIAPLYLLRVQWRGRREPIYASAPGERLGFYREPMVPGAIWVHAVSLGETRAAAPLLEALRAARPGARILLTHGTATGRAAGQACCAQATPSSGCRSTCPARCAASCATPIRRSAC